MVTVKTKTKQRLSAPFCTSLQQRNTESKFSPFASPDLFITYYLTTSHSSVASSGLSQIFINLQKFPSAGSCQVLYEG